jgi:hypothetical protein
MATIKPITNSQLKRLQTLYSQFERLSWDEQRTTAQRRRERLDWARLNIRREIESFSDLSSREANDLTDILQVAMGQRPSREAAKALGARGKKLPGKSDVYGQRHRDQCHQRDHVAHGLGPTAPGEVPALAVITTSRPRADPHCGRSSQGLLRFERNREQERAGMTQRLSQAALRNARGL